MGSLERRIEALEREHRAERLRRAKAQVHAAYSTLSDREILLLALAFGMLEEEHPESLADDFETATEHLEGEMRHAWESCLSSGARAAELEYHAAVEEAPASERQRLREDLVDDPHLQRRLRSTSLIEAWCNLREEYEAWTRRYRQPCTRSSS